MLMWFCRYHASDTWLHSCVVPAPGGCTTVFLHTILLYYRGLAEMVLSYHLICFLRFADIPLLHSNAYHLAPRSRIISLRSSSIRALLNSFSRNCRMVFALIHFTLAFAISLSLSPSRSFNHTHTLGTASPNIVFSSFSSSRGISVRLIEKREET